MNTSFTRKALTCAVLAGLGVAGSAEAVILNPANTGQVLIFPYYTVQAANGNAYNTYISITNTTPDTKVLRVRFREGKTSAEVLDFNIYLSPNDMWVTAITPLGQGAGDAALLNFPGDLSCTDPLIPSAGQPFLNFAYTSGVDALPGTTLDRTREGYVEVFEMAVLTGTSATAVTHPQITTANLVTQPPPNCAGMRSPDGTTKPPSLNLADLLTPTGGLYGQATLINVASGSDFGYVADALDQYATTTQYYTTVGNQTPLLGGNQVVPTNSLRLANGVAFANNFTTAPSLGSVQSRAVASVFMHSAVMNDYILDTGTLSNTDWVLTFPNKRDFVNATTAAAPFSAVMTTAGACEAAAFSIFNRDEQNLAGSTGQFSPPSAGQSAGTGSLCWESTVISWRNGVAHTPSATATASNVLGSKNALFVLAPNGFQNGWAAVTFSGAGATTTGLPSTTSVTLDQNLAAPFAAGPRTFVGLPVTGFMVRTLTNNAISCTNSAGATINCQGNYSTLYRHAYRDVVR